MRYLTDRKRAVGSGAAKTGTEHHWTMMVSSVGLLVLIPLFVFSFAPFIGAPHAEVVAHFSKPFPAIVTALTLVIGFMHFKGGVQVLIEDYVDGLARKIAIIAMICLSYAGAFTGLYAIVRLAL